MNRSPPALIAEPAGDYEATRALLSDPESFRPKPRSIEAVETHMSHVFLAGDRVYKMKKPVHLGFVDFTSLASRRANCEREFMLNQRLAPGVYLETVPVVRTKEGSLQLGGAGEPVEWLLVMARLDREQQLDKAILRAEASPAQIDALCDLLAGFYRETERIKVSPEEWIDWWREAVDLNAVSLRDPLFDLPRELVERVVEGEATFLADRSELLAARARDGRILDGHGDLRPEHVHLGPPLRLIDRLEFNARLRWIDPFDEVAFLGMECDRLGAGWIGPRLIEGLAERLHDRPPPALLDFYTGHRAAMRARLSIEHMRDPNPRTPERWPRQARTYLEMAAAALARLQS